MREEKSAIDSLGIKNIYCNRSDERYRNRIKEVFSNILAINPRSENTDEIKPERVNEINKKGILIKYVGFNGRCLLGEGEYGGNYSCKGDLEEIFSELNEFNERQNIFLDMKILLHYPYSIGVQDAIIAELDWNRSTKKNPSARSETHEWEPMPIRRITDYKDIEYIYYKHNPPKKTTASTAKGQIIFNREAKEVLSEIDEIFRIIYNKRWSECIDETQNNGKEIRESRTVVYERNNSRYPFLVRYASVMPPSSILIIESTIRGLENVIFWQPYNFGKDEPSKKCTSGLCPIFELHRTNKDENCDWYSLIKDNWKYLWEQETSIVFEDAVKKDNRGSLDFRLPFEIKYRNRYHIQEEVSRKKEKIPPRDIIQFDMSCRKALLERVIEFPLDKNLLELKDEEICLFIANEIVDRGYGIQPWFQPILDLKTMKTFGYEALSAIIFKDNLIENMGNFFKHLQKDENLCIKLESFIAKLALEKFKEVIINKISIYNTIDKWKLFLNVSPVTLSSKEFVKALETIPKNIINRVVLEIIEYKPNDRRIFRNLSQIINEYKKKWKSIKIALDDFFCGDSVNIFKEIGDKNYNYLKSGNHPKKLSTFNRMIKGIREKVVIEGISDRKRHDSIMKQKFAYGQGFLYGLKTPSFVPPKFSG